MKKVNVFLVSLVTMVTLGFGFYSCSGGSGSSNNGKVSDMLQVVDEFNNKIDGNCYVKVKNVTTKTLDGSIRVKVQYGNGTSGTQYKTINNMEPGDIQQFVILGINSTVASWSFVDN